MILLISSCGGSGSDNDAGIEPVEEVTLQDSDNILSVAGIDSLQLLSSRVAEKGALAFSIELTQANPELQAESIVRLLKQNNRNIEYQKLLDVGIDKSLVDKLKQLRMSPLAVQKLVRLSDQTLFPQPLSNQAIDLFNQEKLQLLNRKLRLRGQAPVGLTQFTLLQSAFDGVEIVDNFGSLDRSFQNVLVLDNTAKRDGTAAKTSARDALVVANQEVYNAQPGLDSGLPVADSCLIHRLELPLQVSTTGATVNSNLVTSQNGNAIVKLPKPGIALFAISSSNAVQVNLTGSDNTVLVDQAVSGSWYLHLPVTEADVCQPLTFAAADSAYEIKLIDFIEPQRLSQQVYYEGENYLSNAEKVELFNGQAFFNARSYSFASFNSSLSEVKALFEMERGTIDTANTGFDLLIHSPSGNLYAATQSGLDGYHEAAGFNPGIARESGVWRIDLLPPASVTVASNRLSSISAQIANSDARYLKVMTLVSADSQQVQTREFMLGLVNSVSLKTQGEDGIFNEGEVSITLNTSMAPKLEVPDYIDDLLAKGDQMNDTVALWHCWATSEKTGHEFETGESCYEYQDEFLNRFDLYVNSQNNRYDPQNNPEYYQCAQGQDADVVIEGYDYCIKGFLAPWGVQNPSETFKVITVMNDFDRSMRRRYNDANYLHILSNYYDLYQNWQTRSVQRDSGSFPYDGLAYKTNENLSCIPNEEGCSFAGLTLPFFSAPVIIETNRPVFGVPVDRVNETTLPISIDYLASDKDEYDEEGELWAVLSYASSQVVNIATGNFLGMVCDSIGLVDDLHQLELDAEDDPLGSARATINRYSSSDPFYGLHNARSFSFFMSGYPQQNNEIDTYGQKLNYAQIACAATQLSVTGLNFARNANYLLGLDGGQLFDSVSLETTIREAAALAGSVTMAADAAEIAQLIQDGNIDEAKQKLKVNENINNLAQGTDVYSDIASLLDTFSSTGSAENGNNVLKSNAHYLLGSGKKTRAKLEFQRISSLPVNAVSVMLDSVKIISNYESSNDPDAAEIELSPFVGMIDDRERNGINTHALFSQTDDSSDEAWNHLRFTHVNDGDVLSPATNIFNAVGSTNAAALYIELAVIEDDGNSVEDDDMIGVFSQTIKFEEIFNRNAKFKWQHVSGDEYQLKIADFPIYNSSNQLVLENPLNDSYQLQHEHNQNRLPAALVNLTINITLGDLTTSYPLVDTGLEVAEVNAGKNTYSMEMNEVNRIEVLGSTPTLKLDDVFAGRALVYKNGIPIDGTLYSYDVESAELKELFSYDVDSFTGDLLPIKQATFAQKNISNIVDFHSTPKTKRLSMVKLLTGNRLLFVFSADTGAKIMVVSYTDQGVMTLESTTEVVDELSNPVYTLMVARLSPDRSGLLLPYVDANYRGSDRTLAPHPSIMYYQIDGNSVVYKNTLVGSTADTIVDATFIDESNIAVLTNKLLFVTDDSTVMDWLDSYRIDLQNNCDSEQMHCLFEVVDRNIMSYHININGDHQYQMDLMDSFNYYSAPIEYGNGKLLNLYMGLSGFLSNDGDLLNVHTVSVTADSAVIRAGRTLFELWHDPNIDGYVKNGESSLTPVNDLHYNPVGLYYCADAANRLSCSGFLQSANNPAYGEPNTYLSGQPIRQFEFADYDRDLVLGLTGADNIGYLSLFNLYGGAAYKGPQISGEIFDSEVIMDGSDDIPGMAFYFRVTDRDTRIDQLSISVTEQDNPFDVEIKTPFKIHNPLYTASCVTIEDAVDYNCSGTIIPAYENASFRQTVTVSISDGINTSEKSFTLFLDREAPVVNDALQTVSLASADAYRQVDLTFDSATSATTANCSAIDYCYLNNDGFVDEWGFDDKPAWLSCIEQNSAEYGSKLLHCNGQPPMGAAGSYQMQITAFQNKGTSYQKNDSMILTLDVLAPDTQPDAFSFTTQNDVDRNALTESNTVMLSGLTGYATLTLDKGEYRRNGGAWTSAPASNIINRETIQLRLPASGEYSTTTTATLDIGGVSASFTLNTLADPAANDSTPDSFSFNALLDQSRDQLVESNAITVSGITVNADVSVSNGEYKIDNGSWTNHPAQVSNSQTVTVRHTTSSNYSSDVVSTLSIGGVSAEFRSSTMPLPAPLLSAADPISEPLINSIFEFSPVNTGGEVATWSVANKPVWASFDSATGRLSGTVDSPDSFTIDITATNATGSDTFTATVNVQPLDAPYINGYATSCSIDDDVCDFSFSDNTSWRSAVTLVTIGEPYGSGAVTTLSSPDDYQLSAGQLRLKINATNNMVKQSGDWQIVISASGYNDTISDFMLESGTATVGTLSVTPAFAVGQISTVTSVVTNRFGLPSRYASVDVSLAVKNLTPDIDEVYKSAENPDAAWNALTTTAAMSDDSGNLTLLMKLPGCVSAGDGFQLTMGSQMVEFLNNAGVCIDVDWIHRKREIFDRYGGDMAPVVDSQGNSYRLYTTNADFEGNVHNGDDNYYDLYLVKFDRNGEQKWVKLLANDYLSLFTQATSVSTMQIDNDQIYIVGATSLDMDGAGSETALGGRDIFVSSLDTDGNIQWTRQFGSAVFDAPYDMAIHNSKLYLLSKVGQASGDSISADNTVLYTLDMDGTNLQTLMDSSSAVELIDNTTESYKFMRIDTQGNIYLAHGNDVAKYDSSGTLTEVGAALPYNIRSMVLTDHSLCVTTASKDSNNIDVQQLTCMNTEDLTVRWSKQIESNAPYTHGSNSAAFLAERQGVIYTFLGSEQEIFYDSTLAETPGYTLNLIAFNEDDGDMINHKSWPAETRSDAYAESAGIFVNANGNIFLNGRVRHKFDDTFQIGYIQLSHSVQYPQNGILMKTSLAAGANPVALTGMTRSQYQQIVTDHDHALQWDDGWNVSGYGGEWSDADTTCSTLNWAGHMDWRLPTDVELMRGIPYTPQEGSIFQYFNTLANNVYLWTSVEVNGNSHVAVRPQGSVGDGFDNAEYHSYRCVRDN